MPRERVRMRVKHESTSRQASRLAWRRFFSGLPAAVVAVIAVSVVLFGNETPKSQLIREYAAAAKQATTDVRLDAADLYYRKLISLEPFNDEYQFQLALVADDQGNHQRAWGLMSRIAPDTAYGYGPAHLWQAERLYVIARKPSPPVT